MLRFILTGLFLLQFQVTYSSYVCSGPKPACFSTYDPVSTNEIRDGPFCSKQPKETFLLFRPKHLHRFQPFFVKQHNFCTPTLFQNPQTSVSTPIDPEKRITENVCDTKSQEVTQVNNVPEVQMVVETTLSGPEETIYEDEASKQCSPIDTQDRDSEDLSNEPSPGDEVVSASCPTSVDTEVQEDGSSVNLSDNNPFGQCSSTSGPLNEETPLNPSIIPETDREISIQQTEALQSDCVSEPKFDECSEHPNGPAVGSSATTQLEQVTIGEAQVSGEPICAQREIPQSFPARSISLDTACENVSSVSAAESDESSPLLLNTECISSTTTPVVKESFSVTMPTATDLDQITCTHESPGITNKAVTENPMSTALTNQCTNVLSNMLTGLSTISTKTSPSLAKPIYEEVIRHVPTVLNVVRHHLVETTHHVPIVEKIVQHERQDIIRHIPVVQKFTRNVVDCCTKHIPVVQHRARILEERYIEHVPHTEKITRPVIETLVKHVPVVFSRYKPVVHHRIRHVPTVETRCVPVVEESITTVPVKQKVIKHVVEDRIQPIVENWGASTLERTLTPPSAVFSGSSHDHLCTC